MILGYTLTTFPKSLIQTKPTKRTSTKLRAVKEGPCTLNVYNKHRILQKYPKTESHIPIHTGGGMIESHFWIEIPLRLEN